MFWGFLKFCLRPFDCAQGDKVLIMLSLSKPKLFIQAYFDKLNMKDLQNKNTTLPYTYLESNGCIVKNVSGWACRSLLKNLNIDKLNHTF